MEIFPIPFKIVRMIHMRWYSYGWLEKLKIFLRDEEKWGIFSIISLRKAINVKIWNCSISVVSAVSWLQLQHLGSCHWEKEMMFHTLSCTSFRLLVERDVNAVLLSFCWCPLNWDFFLARPLLDYSFCCYLNWMRLTESACGRIELVVMFLLFSIEQCMGKTCLLRWEVEFKIIMLSLPKRIWYVYAHMKRDM